MFAGVLLLAALSAESTEISAAAAGPDKTLSGGDATVSDISPKAFGFPIPGLGEDNRAAFFVGHSFFQNNWVAPPGPPADRAGLGPIFNARSCSACHANDGRGRPPDLGQPLVSMLMRISVPGTGPHHEPLPDPCYGGQLQGQALPGVRPEADVFVNYQEISGSYSDGEKFSLHKPAYTLAHLGYGRLSPKAMISPRVAPVMMGVGLLEAVPADELRALTEQQRRTHSGIHGHLNSVWDVAAGRTAPGRFGWKAEQPSVFQQIATAFNEDMGITSSLLKRESYTAAETSECTKVPAGSSPEVSDKILNDVVLYARTLAVPARRDVADTVVLRGETLFAQTGCAVCHVATLQTGDSDIPQLSRQTIHPYTDLMLHDMGEALSDHRPVFEARGSEWRTPPLWGIGLVHEVNGHTFFLHDGRARNLTEAILWHGGEAEAASRSFRNLPKSDRDALIAFLNSL